MIPLAVVWPYFDLRGSTAPLRVAEGSKFGDSAFRDSDGLYALALSAGLYFLARRRHLFWIAAFVATWLALHTFRALGIEYGNRFAFFQAFFAQAVVAELAGFAMALLLSQRHRLPDDFPIGLRFRRAILLFGAATVVVTAAAPSAREASRAGWRLLTLRGLMALPSTHDVHYATFGKLGRRLGSGDVVLMPAEQLAWDVSSTRFIAPGATADERDEIIRRYHVTKVPVTPSVRVRERELRDWLDPPIADTGWLVLFGSHLAARGQPRPPTALKRVAPLDHSGGGATPAR